MGTRQLETPAPTSQGRSQPIGLQRAGSPLQRRVLASDRYGLAVFVAVVLAGLSLLPLTTDPTYLWLSVALVGVVCLIGVISRRLDLDPLIILLVQVLVSGLALFGLAGIAGNYDLGVFSRLPDLYSQGIAHMASQTIPMAPSPGVTFLFLTGVVVLAIMTDHLVQTVERPLWSLAPLLTPYLVTALMPTITAPWWTFATMALGFLVILGTEGVNRAGQWTRGVNADSIGKVSVAPLVWRTAALVGIPTIVLALVVAMVIPVRYSDGSWSLTPRTGSGGPLQLQNPAQDLKRNLSQPEDRLVITYQTNAEDPEYLRLATLPVFNAEGFSGAPISLQNGTDLPPPPGLTDAPEPSIETQLQITEFNSQYLPLPYPTDRFDAPGDWAYDPESLMVLGAGANYESATANLQYSVQSYPEEPDGAGLSQAEAGTPSDYQLTGEVPADLPPEIIDLTNEVTAGASTPALKAAAIQSYLRSDEFSYSLEPSDSSGYDALSEFLLEDKAGFCVQFAASMAVMARISGIPSRMAVGFLPGTQVGDNYEVTIRNMHAWPELYFEDYGWVRFEPTPSVASPPAWTVTSSEPSEESEESEPTAVPEPEESEPTASASPEPVPDTTDPSVQDDNDTWVILGRVALALGVVALTGLLGAIPYLIRNRRRRIRLSGTGSPRQQVENAWSEVRDLVVDHGYEWPTTSPRDTGNRVSARLDERSARSMQRLSVLVERSRFSREYLNTDDPVPLVKRIHAGLVAGETGRVSRWLTRVWPRSVWTGRFGKRGLR
ncbi:transglutaminaseTgpA domain-containing protein [Naumannella halotolerans]|uniref:transglutaminase family protein n=1 Tax=Naumannella halotolerans TaxID=993414 RepID=UPI00370D4501